MDRKKEVAYLNKKVSTWLNNWVADQYSKISFEESEADLLMYSQGNGVNPSRVDIRTIGFWYLVHYEDAVLNKGQLGIEYFALAARYAEASLRFEEYFADTKQNGSILKTQAALGFSLAVLAGWKESAQKIGKILIRGLDTDLLDMRHNDRHRAGELYRHFWFVLHLFEKFSDSRVDVRLYSYPEDMSPYQSVLSDWTTTDICKVHDLVCAMADFHVQETLNRAHDEVDEFDTEDVMLFPYEILCWLRLREWVGLRNPDMFEHPLMQQPLAKLPASVSLPIPDTVLLDKVIQRFQKEHPSSFS